MTTSHRGILAIWNDCAPGREREYEHWYRGEHLAERVGIDGFVSGWRYLSVDGAPRYFTHYVTESADVLSSPAYHARLNDPTPLTQAIMSGTFLNCTRTICERVLRIGDARGAYAVVARFADPRAADGCAPHLVAIAGHEKVLRAEVWRARAPAGDASFAEFAIRGPDQAIGACVLLETAGEADARAAADRAGEALHGADAIGIYRLMCSLHKADQVS